MKVYKLLWKKKRKTRFSFSIRRTFFIFHSFFSDWSFWSKEQEKIVLGQEKKSRWSYPFTETKFWISSSSDLSQIWTNEEDLALQRKWVRVIYEGNTFWRFVGGGAVSSLLDEDETSFLFVFFGADLGAALVVLADFGGIGSMRTVWFFW